jgi:hypothetical protein
VDQLEVASALLDRLGELVEVDPSVALSDPMTVLHAVLRPQPDGSTARMASRATNRFERSNREGIHPRKALRSTGARHPPRGLRPSPTPTRYRPERATNTASSGWGGAPSAVVRPRLGAVARQGPSNPALWNLG